VHDYPEPHEPKRALKFAPGTIDFGARRSQLEWLTARRAAAAWEFIQGVFFAGLLLIALGLVLGMGTGLGQRFLAWMGVA
jgi:hypothetical protein